MDELRSRARALTAELNDLAAKREAVRVKQVAAMTDLHLGGESWVDIGRLVGTSAPSAQYSTGHATRTPRRKPEPAPTSRRATSEQLAPDA